MDVDSVTGGGGSDGGGGPGLGGPSLNQGDSGAKRRSIAQNVFGGLLRSDVRCCRCGYMSTAHDPFLDLSLEIDDVHGGGIKPRSAALPAALAAKLRVPLQGATPAGSTALRAPGELRATEVPDVRLEDEEAGTPGDSQEQRNGSGAALDLTQVRWGDGGGVLPASRSPVGAPEADEESACSPHHHPQQQQRGGPGGRRQGGGAPNTRHPSAAARPPALRAESEAAGRGPRGEAPGGGGRAAARTPPGDTAGVEESRVEGGADRGTVLEAMGNGGRAAKKQRTFAMDAIVPAPSLALGAQMPAHPAAAQGPISLVDCLARYVRPERLGATERWICDRCKTRQEAVKQLSLRQLPPVLCIHLKRFKHNLARNASRKIDAPVSFPLEGLDLAPFTTSTVLRERLAEGGRTAAAAAVSVVPPAPLPYDLLGFVSHSGSMEGGHYIAYLHCEGRWFRCDDAKVSQVDPRRVQRAEAYMLWYAARHAYAGA